MTMPNWTIPPKLTEEEKLQEKLASLAPRDHAMAVALMTFYSIAYGDGPKPEKSHFKDLAWALLSGCKYVATMDTLKFLDESFAKFPEKSIPIAALRDTINMMGVKVSQSADESLRDAQRLLQLLPEASTPEERKDASK